jgi:cilia- and flagella-associated protein 57
MRVFPEGPISVSMHPSGLHLVVGFSDRLRLMNVLLDDLREVKEFPIKACPQVKFSNGGHAFAAANGSVIQLYSTYSGDYLSSLRGHNGKVLSLHWAHNDATLLSAGLDGSIYEWDLSEGKRSREFISKGVRWSSISASKDGTLVYAAGDGATMPTGFAPAPPSSSSSSSDLTPANGTSSSSTGIAGYSGFSIREIDMASGTVLREIHTPTPITSLVLTYASPRMLFAATAADSSSASVIRSFALPFAADPPFVLATHPASNSPGWVDFPACSAPVVKMVTSRDDGYLFVVGADGSCLAFEVRDKDGRLPASEFGVKVPWAEEVLLTLSDLEDKKNAVRDLRDQVAELQSTNDYTLRMKDIAFQESLKKMTDSSTLELDGERQQFEILREEKFDLEREYTERLNSMEIQHRSEMQKRESLYQGKIMEEVERFQSLQSDVEAQRAMWQNKRSAMVASHLSYMAQLTGDYERRLEAARDRRRELEDEVEGVRRDWEEMRRQMGEDLDKEVEGMRRGYTEKLEAERDATLKFKGENGIMMKKFSALSKEMDEVGEEIRRMNDKQKALRGTITDLEKEISVSRVLVAVVTARRQQTLCF